MDRSGRDLFLSARPRAGERFATSGVPVGSKLPELAPHSASLFGKVSLTPLGLPQLALSAGAYYVDRRPGRDYFSSLSGANPFSTTVRNLPSSTRIDLGAYWDVNKHWRCRATSPTCSTRASTSR